ncbi:hypothetical protein KKD70_01375, partial [Patescibacteria group bacterium]|nr:hypothetical protein [Patescibacteria group bacterium]
IIAARDKIVEFLSSFESNAPFGRPDDAGNYDAEYYNTKDSQDQLNDMIRTVKALMKTSSDVTNYLQQVCQKIDLYTGVVPGKLIEFVKKEFGVDITRQSDDAIKRTEYESRMSLVPLGYFVTVEQAKKLIPYEKYREDDMSIDQMYTIISEKFPERSDHAI